jgi:hypothetical protein
VPSWRSTNAVLTPRLTEEWANAVFTAATVLKITRVNTSIAHRFVRAFCAVA